MTLQLLITPNQSDLSEILNQLNSSISLPFEEKRMRFLAKLSEVLFKSDPEKKFPDLHSVAFWLRRASLENLKKRFFDGVDPKLICAPRGISFHVIPKNVETMLLFSTSIAFLTGNSVCAKISSAALSPTMDKILNAYRISLDFSEFQSLRESFVVLQYPNDDAITQRISMESSIRVIWGGDASVDHLKTVRASRRCKDLVFPDRYSFAILDAENYLNLPEEKGRQLAQAFFNDAYWFGQMACSSPRHVLWRGNQKNVEEAVGIFYQRLSAHLKSKAFENDASMAMDMLTLAHGLVAEHDQIQIVNCASDLMALKEQNLVPSTKVSSKGGFFVNSAFQNWDQVLNWIGERDQTIAYFGIDTEDLKNLVLKLKGRGIDRIVPLGQALQFDVVWDGYDLMKEMVRFISVSP